MILKYFDSHTHTNLAAFDTDYKEAIGRASDLGVGLINVGTQKATSLRAIQIADEFKDLPIYAAVGLHPSHVSNPYYDKQEVAVASEEEKFDYDFYKKIALNPKVVAIGECGLDLFRVEGEKLNETREKQKQAFLEQIKLAEEVKKPLMIHCREAFSDLIEMLNSYFIIHNSSNPGVIHFFTGTKEDAKNLLDLGFFFTFGGVVTFVRDYDEVIKMIPLDRLLSETDAPYVAPVPYRGKRNEPAYVVEVVKKLAEIKEISLQEMAEQILKNNERIFGIKLTK